MTVTKQKDTSFGGRTSQIQNESFICVVTTAKDGVFSELSTLLWLPSVGAMPVAKIEYADKCDKDRRHCLHRDIVNRIDDAGQSNLGLSDAINFALKPYVNNGEITNFIISTIASPLNNEESNKEKPSLSKEIAIEYLRWITGDIDKDNSRYSLEKACLYCCAIDISTSDTLEENSVLKIDILNEFYFVFLDWLHVEHQLSQKDLNVRLVKYAAAINERHKNGPAWSVGKVFAELTGSEMDIAEVIYGGGVWEGMVVGTKKFLEEVIDLEEQVKIRENFTHDETDMNDLSIMMEKYTLIAEENELKKNEDVIKKAGIVAIIGAGLWAGASWVASNL